MSHLHGSDRSPSQRSFLGTPGSTRVLRGALAVAPLVMLAVVVGWTVSSQSAHATSARSTDSNTTDSNTTESNNTEIGRDIWMGDCAVCHGTRGEGSFQGPPIAESGTAAIHFMVSTGRMPRKITTLNTGLPWSRTPRDSLRAEPKYSKAEIDALVAYTAGFISGPEVPTDIDLTDADLAKGGELYRLQCSTCHQMAGSGGSLAYGTVGPSLHAATPVQVIEAIRTGPGSMPVYPPTVIADSEATNIAAYVKYLEDPVDRGGLALWHLGPVPEGLVAWVVGLGLIIVMCRWLGKPASEPD